MEITASQYAERRGVNNADDYRRAYHRIVALLIMMDLKKKRFSRSAGAMETTEMLKRFLDKLSAKNYDMTPEEVYQASIETVEETM